MIDKGQLMGYIDTRTYNHLEMWKREGKSAKWRNGYIAGFEGKALPMTASDEYKEGYSFGANDKERENNPPFIKGGFPYGHGYDPTSMD